MRKLLMIVLVIIIGGFMFAENPQVKMSTSQGDILIELYQDKAPITVNNFLNYVKDGFYNGTVFHRVIADFMIQAGGYSIEGKRLMPKEQIKNEADNGLKNETGTIAMARTPAVDSATSQFFINCKNNDNLNHSKDNFGYCVFGKVIEGMEVVNKIQYVPTGQKNRMRDWPIKDIVIKKVIIVSEEE